MSLFHHQQISFGKVDPLGDGLGDEIAAEQREAESISSLEDATADELNRFWSGVVEDIKKDPEWFEFDNE